MGFGDAVSKAQGGFGGFTRKVDGLHTSLGGPDPGSLGPAPQVSDQGYAKLRDDIDTDINRNRGRGDQLDFDSLTKYENADPKWVSEHQNRLGIGSTSLVGKTTDDLIAQLAGAIYGTKPSVAQGLLQQATDRNSKNAFGNATSGVSGGNAILGLQSGIQAAGDADQQAGGQASTLRASEIDDATSQLAQLIAGQNAAQNALRTQQNAAEGNAIAARGNQVATVNGLQTISNQNAALEQQRKANQGKFGGQLFETYMKGGA